MREARKGSARKFYEEKLNIWKYKRVREKRRSND